MKMYVLKIMSLVLMLTQLIIPTVVTLAEESHENETIIKLFGLVDNQKLEALTVDKGDDIPLILQTKNTDGKKIMITLPNGISIDKEEIDRLDTINDIHFYTTDNELNIISNSPDIEGLLINLHANSSGNVQLQASSSDSILSNIITLTINENEEVKLTEQSTTTVDQSQEDDLASSFEKSDEEVTSIIKPVTGINAELEQVSNLPYFIINGGFEQPFLSKNRFLFFHQSKVPGWQTTATDQQIEIASGNGGLHAFNPRSGQQWAEINANVPGELNQVVRSIPGSTMNWSVWHAGRDGNNKMAVHIGTSEQHPTVFIADSPNRVWTQYTGTYTVPEDQYETYFGFESLEYTGASIGNYIDDVSFKILGNLSTNKQVDKSFVKAGEHVTYTINATNTIDFSLLENIIVEDTLPEGLQLVKDSLMVNGEKVTNEANQENQIKTTLATIVGNQTVSVTFEAEVLQKNEGTIKNVAIVTIPEDPTHPQTPSNTIEVNGLGNLKTKKRVDHSKVMTGEEVTYTIEVENSVVGSTLEDILVEDRVPSGLDIVENTLTVDGHKVENQATETNVVKILLNKIAGNQKIVVSFKAKVVSKKEGIIINTAEITDPSDPSHPQKPSAKINVITKNIIRSVQLATEKLVDKTIVQSGDLVTYTIRAHNLGTETALNNIIVEDKLPKGVELIKGTLMINELAAKNETKEANQIKVSLEKIEPESTIDVHFTAIVTQKTEGIINNIALVTDLENEHDPQTPEKSITVEHKNRKEGALIAKKIVNQSKAAPGDEIMYTIETKNIVENTQLNDIVIEDQLPEGIELVKNTLTVDNKKIKNIADGNNKIKTVIEKIKGNQTVRIHFKVKIQKQAKGIIKNVASVTNPAKPKEPLSPEASITIVQRGQLETKKIVDQSSVSIGDQITYTIAAKNIISDTFLKNVVVEDILPAGLELVDGSLMIDGKQVANESNKTNTIQVTLSSLKGGYHTAVQFKVNIIRSLNDRITNIATVTDPSQPKTPQKPEVSIDVEKNKMDLKKVSEKSFKPHENLPKANDKNNYKLLLVGVIVLIIVFSTFQLREK